MFASRSVQCFSIVCDVGPALKQPRYHVVFAMDVSHQTHHLINIQDIISDKESPHGVYIAKHKQTVTN